MSKSIGEEDGVVWDYIAVYQPGTMWDQGPPEHVYSNAPVIYAIVGTSEAIQKLLQANGK